MKNLININLSQLVEIKDKYKVDDVNSLVETFTKYLKCIGFKDAMILASIVIANDEEAYNEFLKTHKDIQIDLNGKLHESFSWWEPLLELSDALYTASKEKLAKGSKSKSIIDAYELNNAEEYLKNNKDLGEVEDNLNKFISMHELSYDEESIKSFFYKVETIMNKKEKISIKPVFSAVLLFYMNRQDYRTVDLIVARLSYLTGDKKLRYESNKNFYERLKNLAYLANNSNNLLY